MRALTGVETDRLPAERERGMTIELGYAPLSLPDGRRLSIVDVPGHERFVRTMVAGATGIDLYLMTIAADDGVMPQTREHATVLEALGVRKGVVAITKSDVRDPAPAIAAARRLLPGAEVVACSARTGEGCRTSSRRSHASPHTCDRGRRRRAGRAARRPRVHDPRGRHRADRHAVERRDRARGHRLTLLPAGRAAGFAA